MSSSLKGMLVGLLMLVLAACASPVTGTVVDKEHKPAYSYVQMVPIYGTRCDAQGYCTTYISSYVPVTQYVPDRYRLRVQEDDGDLRWVSVSANDYEIYDSGEWFTNDPDSTV